VDGIQVKANLVEDGEHVTTEQADKPLPPRARASSPHNDLSDVAFDADEHVPTVDELAKSFIRTEPTEEIQELAQELQSQSSSLQESTAWSDDGEDDSPAGVGAPLALPTYLRNILNTALDRLSIVIDNIDVEVEDQTSTEPTTPSKSSETLPVSLNFHIERVGIDSVTAEEPHVEVSSTTLPHSNSSRLGKRRLRIENICARLVSNGESFISKSRVSRSPSPETMRSEISTEQPSSHEPSASAAPLQSDHETQPVHEEELPPVEVKEATALPVDTSIEQSRTEVRTPVATSQHEISRLVASVATVDDDRFADASSDDGLEQSSYRDGPDRPRHPLATQRLSGSSILYDDEGILDYALEHDMLDSRFDEDLEANTQPEERHIWNSDDSIPSREAKLSPSASEASLSDLPTVSGLGVSFPQERMPIASSRSTGYDPLEPSTDEIITPSRLFTNAQQSPADSTHSFTSPPASAEDVSESMSSSEDASESMYMSAIDATPVASSQKYVPGGWDSSSTSSRGTASDRSGSIPEEMISGSILQPLSEMEGSCETPRPGSRQSTVGSPGLTRAQLVADTESTVEKQAKVFLTIDEVTVWFPLGLDKEKSSDADSSAEAASDASSLNFTPARLGEDSIFAEMPGSFSNYAHSTSSRRAGSMAESLRRPPQPTRVPQHTKAAPSPNVIIDVGSVAGHVDLSTGRIMFGMLSRVLKALADEPQQAKPNSPLKETHNDDASTMEMTVNHIGVAWLENVLAESVPNSNPSSHMLDLKPSDALLRTNLSAVCMTSHSSMGTTRTKLQIENFTLSSLGIDIISFHNARPRSRRSVSNLSEQLNHDIEIDYEQGTDKRITIVTRPLKVAFDIQHIDDALSSFGGFSGILELGNSISSNHALNSPILSPPPPKSRGVHFGDAPSAPVTPVQASNMPKIQIQLGEVSCLLKGRSCAVQLQTTTVRIAVRQSNVRLKVSEVQLSGPYLDTSQRGAPLLVEVQGTTVNFLFAPEETDLARLISLITPSKDPYENNEDILIDTLLRQRRKGSVLRVEVGSVGVRVFDLEQMRAFETLGAELARLAKVTKYLPEDDRPGLLTLALVQQLDVNIAINDKLGDVAIAAQNASVAHVGFPALFALEVGTASLKRENEILVHEVVSLRPQDQLPMIMVRMVGDELEPVVKAKLFNLCAEYRVSTVMAALGIADDGTVEDIAIGIASSVATITGSNSPKPISRQSSQASSPSGPTAKPLQIDLLLRSCAIGLNPRNVPSKGLFVLTEAHLAGKQAKDNYSVKLELRRASIHAIDDVARLDADSEEATPASTTTMNRHLQELSRLGFVSLSSISAAKVLVDIAGDGKDTPQLVNVEFKNELLVLESCADSTQTLVDILNGLQPPSPPSTAERYRTVVPLQEMMESFTGDAMPADEGIEDDDFMDNADLVEDEVPTNLEFVGSIYNQDLPTDEDMGDSMLGEDDLGALAASPVVKQRGDRGLLESFQEQYEVTKGEDNFDFSTDYFNDSDSERKGKARKWDSTQNQYHLTNEFKTPDAPLKIQVRDVNIIWNLFDGYDWPRTRSIITEAVDNVEARAEERRRNVRDEEDDDDFVEEDFLFNSVWIGVPIKEERGALARRINHDIDDLASETGSYATSTATRSTGATARPRSATKPGRRRLKLERSKHKKIAFSLMGVAVDLVVYPPDSGETLNSLDVRVQDFEIFDHVPTSTWKKFITCVIPPSQREMNRPMINLNLLTVKPVTDLAASELVIRVSLIQTMHSEFTNFNAGICSSPALARRSRCSRLYHPLLRV
jgi:autophagy-related protein 2